jgi:hypothetical protein
MSRRVTPRSTVVVVSLLFSVCFALQLYGRSSSPKAAVRTTAAPLVDRPGPAPDLSLRAARAVPALRDPRTPPKPKPKPKPKAKPRKVVVAPKPAPTVVAPRPTATPEPVATAAPRPRYTPPARTPAPTPKPKPEPSGSFDTSGQS